MPRLDYERVNWADAPSEDTPISAENLNKMDAAIAYLFANIGDMEVPQELADGTYVLKATIADGDVTFEWVAESE